MGVLLAKNVFGLLQLCERGAGVTLYWLVLLTLNLPAFRFKLQLSEQTDEV
jgi:hypothetical protein